MGRTNSAEDVFKHVKWPTEPGGCYRWTGSWGGRARDRRPYFQYDGRRTLAYRIVWELVNGPIPNGMMILHSCDCGGYPIGCCSPHHMRLGTVQENSNDMMERERSGLPASVRRAIRTLLDQGRTQQSIADLYGVSRETISAIATGRVYRGDQRTADDPPPHDAET